MSRISRRNLLQLLGVAGAGLATTAAGPATSLLDTRTRIAADATPVQFARVGAPANAAQARAVARLDDTHRMLADGGREVLLRPSDVELLQRVGVDVTVLDADLLASQRQVAGARVAPQPGQRDDYRFFEDFETDLRMLVAAFPDKARLITFAETSLTGHVVHGIEIASDVTAVDGRPVVHADACHHSREWPAAEMAIMWAHDLLFNHGSDPRVTNIVDNARTVIIPMVNPDGFIRSRESLVQVDDSSGDFGLTSFALAVGGLESYWRKNLRTEVPVNAQVSAGQGARYGNPAAHGIDLNRNYGFLWGDDEGSSGVRADQTYRGESPYSEPEARNVRASFLRTAPIAAITHHTSGEIMLSPWGRDPDAHRSRDWQVQNDLGLRMQASNGYVPKQAFGLYPTSGTSRDWGHAATSTVIYTFEHGQEFHGPYEATIPAMYEKNRGAFLTHSEFALDPSSHLTITGEIRGPGGVPVAGATIRATKSQKTPVVGGTFVQDDLDVPIAADADGRFTFHLPPSTRPFLEAAPADLDDVQEPRGNPYPGGLDPVLASHGLTAGTEPYVLVVEAPGRAPVSIPVTGGRGDAIDLATITV